MRSVRWIAILLIASNVGCASVGVRTGAYGRHRAAIYPATVVDVGLVAYVVARPFLSLDPTFHLDAQERLNDLFVPAAIIDFPLAVAVDTLLLPYDLHKLRDKEPDHDSCREWNSVIKDKSPNDPFNEESL